MTSRGFKVVAALVAAAAIALTGCASGSMAGAAGSYVASIPANVTGQSAPFTSIEAVTLTGSAGADWTPTKAVQTRALFITNPGSGVLKVDMADGTTGVSVAAIPTGQFNLSVTKIYNSTDGTSITALVALY